MLKLLLNQHLRQKGSYQLANASRTILYVPLMMMASGGYLYSQMKIRSDCLGIFGIVTTSEQQSEATQDICLRGLRELAVKGYDSCGVATVNQTAETPSIVLTKHT
jgi:hypothetical protein